MTPINKVFFEIPFADFKTHIEDSSNVNILFSGKFGSGKTTFIKYFFEDQNDNSEEYEYFHLFPVNYSIGTNEDIMELIKYDIIIEMIRKQIPVDERDVDNNYFFLKENWPTILSLAVRMLPKIGKDLSDLICKLDEFKKQYDDHNKKLKETTNEGVMLLSFLEKLENQPGALVEKTLLTKTIRNILQRRKDEKKVKTVLVLDDIDRIDPEHIFRILNVLAAHIDQRLFELEQTSSKFGFDKVIIVCDVDNIRRIFRARYGQGVDFSGYIDKFYSKQVFHFYTHQAIVQLLEDKISNFTISSYHPRGNHKKLLSELMPRTYRDILLEFLSTLIDQNILTLRRVLMINNQPKFSRPVEINFRGNTFHVDST